MKLHGKLAAAVARLESGNSDFKLFVDALAEETEKLTQEALWAEENVDLVRGQAQQAQTLLKTIHNAKKFNV